MTVNIGPFSTEKSGMGTKFGIQSLGSHSVSFNSTYESMQPKLLKGMLKSQYDSIIMTEYLR